jgi:hypothetical protein
MPRATGVVDDATLEVRYSAEGIDVRRVRDMEMHMFHGNPEAHSDLYKLLQSKGIEAYVRFAGATLALRTLRQYVP